VCRPTGRAFLIGPAVSEAVEQDKRIPSPPRRDSPPQYNATLILRRVISPGLLILRVKPDADLFSFLPGQFAVLGLLGSAPRTPDTGPDPEGKGSVAPNKLIQRAYSIASSSVEHEYLEFYVNIVPSGQFTPRLFNLKVGDRLFLGKKASGVFTLDRVPPEKHVVFLATGTGLAPYMSMLRTHLVCGAGRQYVVLHGARYSWDLGYRPQLEILSRIYANFWYIPSITRAQEDPLFSGHIGRIQVLLERGVIEQSTPLALSPHMVEVFLCGNPAMIEAAEEWLVRRGFTPGSGKVPGTIHAEKYW
jgi:ferredoxin/flavodoxin---NADP+ reductase